jgi:hypothetical protein
MGTKQFGWPAARILAVRGLALTLSVASALIVSSTAQAQDQRKAREKIVELNKQALLSYEAKDFETARDLLTKALKEAKQARLEDDKMTARTYLHLGAVYWVGFQDQPVALQNFSLAKKIRPDIQLTPSIETPDLKSVFDLATAEAEAEPPAKPTTPGKPAKPVTPPPTPAPRLVGSEGGGEPDLPTSFPSPLLCSVPDVVPPNKEMTIRCALKPGLNAKAVQIHYRSPGVEAYQSLGMRRTAKGWHIVTLPSSVMKAGTIQVYFDARDVADNELATNGQIDSPSIIEVRKKGGSKGATGECPLDDPMCQIRRKKVDDDYEAGLHRRREGAVWFGVGPGYGFGYAPGGRLEWRKDIKVSAITAPVGQILVLPEVGYLITDHFGIALEAIIERIAQQQLPGESGPSNIPGAPMQWGGAGFLRAIYLMDLADGNLQFSVSADVGGGYLRIPVKPHAQGEMMQNPTDPDGPLIHNPKLTIFKTDTRLVGTVLFGPSAGLIYHFSRHFALSLEGKALIGLPSFGALLQGSLSAQLAFGGGKGPEPVTDEDGEGPVIKDEPPTTDLGNEEEE